MLVGIVPLDDSSSRCRRLNLVDWIHGGVHGHLTIYLHSLTLSRDMAWLTTVVAGFAGRIEGTAVGGRAVSRDVSLIHQSAGRVSFSCVPQCLRACHMRNTSSPGLGSLVHSDLALHICSKWPDEGYQRRSHHGILLHILHGA